MQGLKTNVHVVFRSGFARNHESCEEDSISHKGRVVFEKSCSRKPTDDGDDAFHCGVTSGSRNLEQTSRCIRGGWAPYDWRTLGSLSSTRVNDDTLLECLANDIDCETYTCESV